MTHKKTKIQTHVKLECITQTKVESTIYCNIIKLLRGPINME